MAKNVQLHVRLGEADWSKHTYARTDGDADVTLLGSVQKGQQHGALALKADGEYVMLVGDYEMPLNQHQIRAAMQNARPSVPRVSWSAHKTNATVPVVIVKKRRVVSIPA